MTLEECLFRLNNTHGINAWSVVAFLPATVSTGLDRLVGTCGQPAKEGFVAGL